MTTELIASKKVVICVNPKMQKSKSGLDLPTAENKPETGEVIVIGEGQKPFDFKVGDTIVYRKYTENKIFIGGTEYNFVRFLDILGAVKK